MKNLFKLVIMCCIGLCLTACGSQSPAEPLKIIGGGFMFNYRYAITTYGFVVRQTKPLPEGSILEATFDLPDSDKKYVLKQPAQSGKLQYSFESEALHGVKKDTPYKVQLKLLEANTGKQLALVERDFKSTIDQDTLPVKAPVVGIGYQKAPE